MAEQTVTTTTCANTIFEQYLTCSDSLTEIIASFRSLCDAVGVNPDNPGWPYKVFKDKIRGWKATSLWNILDKRINHNEYMGNTVCSNKQVLVVGAGPCGLRIAIECKLLGARCVIVELRKSFSRNNVLHLWPFVIDDLKSLGGKVFFPQCCAGAIDHVAIRKVQYMLLKVALLLGVELHTGVAFAGLVEPAPPSASDEQSASGNGWRALTDPPDHPVASYEFNVVVGADGKANSLSGFPKKEFRGKLAVGITANFVNHHTKEENGVEEVGGAAYVFKQQFFNNLKKDTGIDLENIVYYKDETHYFVMTAKRLSLIQRGVLKSDSTDTAGLLADDNVNQEELARYARDAADYATSHTLPNLEFVCNSAGRVDVSIFDFTSLWAADNASRFVERHGKCLLTAIIGDGLLEPFWPTGSGCARGFLSALDTAWMIRSWALGKCTPLELLAERESLYRLLSQTTVENLKKSTKDYTICPRSRYVACTLQHYKPDDMQHLYDAK